MQTRHGSQKPQNWISIIVTLFLAIISVGELTAQSTAPVAIADQHPRRLVVSIPHRKIALIENGRVKKVYAVAVGSAETPSPTGTFQVKNRLVKPTYYHPGKVIPAGAGNPLGTRWIGLNVKGYGIHGTNLESSVGQAASHGCIRMHRDDLEQLFSEVQIGDEVEIRDGDDSAELAAIFDNAVQGDTTSRRIEAADVTASYSATEPSGGSVAENQ